MATKPLRPLGTICSDDASLAITQMENSPDEAVCGRIWKMHRDQPHSSPLLLAQLMLTFKFMTKKIPEGLTQVLSRFATAKYNAGELRKEFLSKTSSLEVCDLVQSLDEIGVLVLATQICKDVRYSLTRPILSEFLSRARDGGGCASNPEHLAQHYQAMELDDSAPEPQLSGWQPEAIKLHNTIRKVAAMGKQEGKVGKFYSEILQACDQTKELLDALDQGKCSYDREVVLIGWMDEIIKIFSKPDYLEAKGVSYQVLKNVSNKVSLLRESICKCIFLRVLLRRFFTTITLLMDILFVHFQNLTRRFVWC
ncbi:ML [Jos virus]|uniref:ML n=1 Tax=Jos virus TaxID=1027466 RepID=H6SW54_9ORTO|nr:ML [Jos virus]AED98373.1 ML [Jos virus]